MSFASNFPEIRANLKLALPLITAQLAGVGMGATDAMMVGQIGADELAAVAVAVNISAGVYIFVLGIFMGASAIVSQRRGAGVAAPDIGRYTRSLLILAMVTALAWCVFLQLIAAPAVHALDLNAQTSALAIDYLRAYAFTAFGMSAWFALRFVAEGLEEARPVMLAGLAGLVVNALLNWVLIFGCGPIPAYGVWGSAVASALACVVMAVSLALFFRRHPRLRPLTVFARQPRERGAVRETIRLGLPIALILVAEAGLFVVVAMLMARLGERTVAAYQVALNFASLVFMIPLGISFATTVRVGYFLGAGEFAAARAAGLVGMGMGMSNAVFNASLMLLFGTGIAALYTQDEGIAAQAVGFLVLAAIFQLADGLQATANGALRGLKDTRLPMLITLTSYWFIGLPVAWWLCFHTPLKADGLWWGLTAGLAAAAVGLSLRFHARTHRYRAPPAVDPRPL